MFLKISLIFLLLIGLVKSNIVMQDPNKGQVVMTDDNIVLKGDFFGGNDNCEETRHVEHVWLPMQQPMVHGHNDGWNSQASNQVLKYLKPSRRSFDNTDIHKFLSSEQKILKRQDFIEENENKDFLSKLIDNHFEKESKED